MIFICTFDLFGEGKHKYTFENRCKEDKSLKLGDGTQKIFLNAMGTEKDVKEDLSAFLGYVAGRKNNHPFVRKVDAAVREARKNEKWRREYMTLLMRDQENIERGRTEGRTETRHEMIGEMLRNHIPVEKIAKIAHMSIAEITEIGQTLGITIQR